MTREGVQAASSAGRLTNLVDAYARRVYPAVLDQQRGASVASPLGVWLLLAACASAAQGSELTELEEALGCRVAEAGSLLASFMDGPPPALRAAIALWVNARDATDAVAAWARGLPERVESGFMPTQREADAWARRETLGLIHAFPLEIDELTRIILASALATRVSWETPFAVVPATSHLGPGSPWRAAVRRLLWAERPAGGAMIARTEAAGLVAVHCAVAREDLTVISVSADASVARGAVLAAAHEVARALSEGSDRLARSLWDLPLGPGHSWEISEQEVAAYVPEPRLERIAGAALPAWSVRGTLELRTSPLFGTDPALEALRRLIGPRPEDECQAVQAAVASFTRYGFEAAAVTAFGVRASAARIPAGRTTERSAILRFDHPYAALAIAGRPVAAGGGVGGGPSPDSAFAGLPLFTAWVHDPIEPEDKPPGA